MSKTLLLSLFFGVFVFFSAFVSIPVYAHEKDSTISAKLERGGSYEVFWPLIAGKTMDDPLYFLKRWRENIGGLFIFDNARKSDYEVMISTKRFLEMEKLLKEGKEDLARKTLDKASAQLIVARGKFSKATKEGNDFQLTRVNLINQLSNLDAFIPGLSELGKRDLKQQNLQVKDIVEKFLSDVKNP